MTSEPTPSDRIAPFGVADEASRGRCHVEPVPEDESAFEFDRRRILSCTTFRRLMHKTQVFVTGRGDHFRTRLTHTIEVASQAQRLARRLGLNAALADAIALAHDLGHPPFGHAGEKALSELMAAHGGFEHNLQALRVVDYLEHPYPAFRGLNLTFEVRESLVKHETRYDLPDHAAQAQPSLRSLMEVGPHPSLEGQVVNLADAVAYTLHDVEDGLAEGLLTAESLGESRLWQEAARPLTVDGPIRNPHAVRRPILYRMAAALVADAVAESRRRIAAAGVMDVDAVRRQSAPLIVFSLETKAALEELQDLLSRAVYRNRRVIRMDSKARRLIRDLFAAYLAEPELLPERFSRRIAEQGAHRVVCDYVAGMTDRFCQEEHSRLHSPHGFE